MIGEGGEALSLGAVDERASINSTIVQVSGNADAELRTPRSHGIELNRGQPRAIGGTTDE